MPRLFIRLRVRCLLGVLFFSSLTLCLWLGHVPWQQPDRLLAQSVSANQQVQQGVDHYRQGNYPTAIAAWKTALEHYRRTGEQSRVAIVLENLARAYQQLGQTETEIIYWNELLTLYQQRGNQSDSNRIVLEQAQAYSRYGQPRKAIALLCHPDVNNQCASDSVLQRAHNTPNRLDEAAALGSLGDAYRLLGEYATAEIWLNRSLELAKQLNHLPYQVAALKTLGNVYSQLAEVNDRRATSAAPREKPMVVDKFRQRQQEYETRAITAFDQSFQFAREIGDHTAQMQSLLGKLSLTLATPTPASAMVSIQQAISLLEQLPPSRQRVYATIDLTRLATQLHHKKKNIGFQCLTDPSTTSATIEPLLQQAVRIAQTISDRRAESFALGELGHHYECQGDRNRALTITQTALQAAEAEPDSRYLWEWQAGRILKAQERTHTAIALYNQAIATLTPIRNDLLLANPDRQFDFRDAIEPIYREAIALQVSVLEKVDTRAKQNPEVTDLQTFDTILKLADSLRLAELQNYFGNDCAATTILPKATDVARTMTATAVVNSLILSDRTIIVMSFPNGSQRWHIIPVNATTLQQEVNAYRRDLERHYDPYTPERAQTLYNWIVRPFADALEQSGIRTLVFIQDGILRTVPMAALHDGKQFLVQRYAVVTSPSLALTDLRMPHPQQTRSLAMGITQSVTTVDGQYFPPLPNVQVELQNVQARLPNSQVLLNQDFSRDRLGQTLNQTIFPVLHIATHAQFGAEPADTFLVTGDRQKLTLTELDRLIRRFTRGQEAIDLLALTACQTAVGDDRAALGVAGVAIQAGVKSALASLWSINDAATAQVVSQFYTHWQPASHSKAEALQKAQQALIASDTYSHPAYWAPFVLVGNWL